jgi:mRNA interferase MazF
LPITSKNIDKINPYEVLLGKGSANLPKDSGVKANQIRTLDKSRIIKYFGGLSEKDINAIDLSLKIHLDLK